VHRRPRDEITGHGTILCYSETITVARSLSAALFRLAFAFGKGPQPSALMGSASQPGRRRLADIRSRGVIVELQVETETGDRTKIAENYMAQPTQYAGCEARQISMVLVRT
jgi:hypothetical protein